VTRKWLCAAGAGRKYAPAAPVRGRSTSPLEVSWRRPYYRMALAPYVGYTLDGEPKLRVGSGQGRPEPA
jgi:hypothetical protein